MYKLVYPAEAKAQIGRFSVRIRRQIKRAAERLSENPDLDKKLTQELDGFMSYRTGDYRIIYQVYHGDLVVIVFCRRPSKRYL